ncbi:HlyD family efflux transporter periplasmic adaptor subunit [Sphingomonas paeninsulae]|jgi:membrane fusion protein (multidrug efflux system)|uniref:HlyD family efflux transporter periplasmic adaptor subunit n=1 Tax=Sphingomonas paeninsulae TaxID=2319844 RepID=A0A494TAL4_SPHPE|nr:HlyD family efflux transporter periplasmic adaptor subunit [Sphingomonas paeninsulae]AYJ86377.1 HlyD family efflux transporter periplasmic adaptor subunit [Sphingomonas paeninsulae]
MADANPSEMTAAQEESPSANDQAENKAPPRENNAKRKKLFLILAIVVAVIAILWGIWYFVTQAGRVHTDNAYVGADTAQVTPLVAGAVKEVRVGGTQVVHKGDILVVIDDADAKVDVATAQAALFAAQQRYGQADANVGAARAKVDARVADIAQARAKAADSVAQLERARVDLSRREALVGSGAVSGEELSSARAAYSAAKADRDLAAAGIATAQATRTSALSDVAATEALTRGTNVSTTPDVASARARLDKAQLDLSRTIIRAPIDGVVTNRQVQVGQRVAAGTPIMTLVPLASVYVDANFKESQFRRIKIGQPVELTSDFYGSGVVYHGRVTGYAGGTGAAFSLIPAQNATGNWIKVVQRLPVRVTLDARELRDHPLRVGLSMDAIIDTRGDTGRE